MLMHCCSSARQRAPLVSIVQKHKYLLYNGRTKGRRSASLGGSENYNVHAHNLLTGLGSGDSDSELSLSSLLHDTASGLKSSSSSILPLGTEVPLLNSGEDMYECATPAYTYARPVDHASTLRHKARQVAMQERKWLHVLCDSHQSRA